ncbi:hypothetical protein PROSTU_01506 [Providencia stuartii ATCC 25827]|uniref:Uncharacterized protein n=1 Tax=Providencia stuartii ATCC 25827 TaxID=471874 RepID=A0AA86YJ51_PROST|nr:hypothetical protein PROSTU_01506 [Providencia stuartii ATCC 25827]
MWLLLPLLWRTRIVAAESLILRAKRCLILFDSPQRLLAS